RWPAACPQWGRANSRHPAGVASFANPQCDCVLIHAASPLQVSRATVVRTLQLSPVIFFWAESPRPAQPGIYALMSLELRSIGRSSGKLDVRYPRNDESLRAPLTG